MENLNCLMLPVNVNIIFAIETGSINHFGISIALGEPNNIRNCNVG